MGIRSRFVNKLNIINKNVVNMGDSLVEILNLTKKAIIEDDINLIDTIILDKSKEIMKLESRLTDKTTQLISREQPVASDLRMLVSILKILTHFERIGAHIGHIAKTITKESKLENRLNMVEDFITMLSSATIMLNNLIKSFTDQDSKLALETIEMDNALDNIHHRLLREIIEKISDNSSYLESGLNYIFLSRFIERIGDLVRNCCEWVIFAKKGTHKIED